MEVHLRLSLLGLLLTFGLLDFHGGVLFEPFGLIVGFLLQKSLIVLVLGEIEPLVDILAVGKVFQFNLMLAEKKVSPGLQAVGIVGDILRRVALPLGLRYIEGFLEVLAGLYFGTTGGGSLLALPLLTLLVRFIRGIIVEREVRIAADRVCGRRFKHRQSGPRLVEKILYLLCRQAALCGIRFVKSEDNLSSLIGRGLFLQIGNDAF